MLNPQISRREFLKLASAGTLALALHDLRLDRAAAAPAAIKQGRITWSGIPLYDFPAFQANQIHHFGADKVIEIAGIEENGDAGNPYNSTWYRVDNGYTYSGWIQPVETNYQKPVFVLPEKGQVGEITVPYCDTKKEPYTYAERGYRIYFGSTHWVKKVVVQRDEKSIWYEIYDFHLKRNYYVASHDMRLVPDEELTTLSPEVPDEEKKKSVAEFNFPQYFKLTWIAELPFGKGRHFNMGSVGNALVGGWNLTGIHNYRSGSPISIPLHSQQADGRRWPGARLAARRIRCKESAWASSCSTTSRSSTSADRSRSSR